MYTTFPSHVCAVLYRALAYLCLQQWQNYNISWVKRCTTACSAHIITPSGSPEVSSKPYLELRALQDISQRDMVLSKSTVSNVTTCTPEDIMAKSTLESTDHFYCDTCATLLIVPGDSPDNYAARLPFLPSDPRPDPAQAPPRLMELSVSLKTFNVAAIASFGAQVPYRASFSTIHQRCLSSIVINDPPASMNLSTVPPFLPTSRKEVYQKPQIRAIYHLACALPLCGGGARSDALGLLDDARARYGKLMSWETCDVRFG